MGHISIRQIDITTIPTNIAFPDIFNHGSTSAHSIFRGRQYEVTFDTSKNTLVTHDGSRGGYALLREDQRNLPSGGVNNGLIVPGNNTLSLVTDGNQHLTIDASGNIGVGIDQPSVKFHIEGTDAIKIPVGDTSERPSSPEAGMVRYLTPNNILEYYDGTNWATFAGEQPVRMGPLSWLPSSVNVYPNPIGKLPSGVNIILRYVGAVPAYGYVNGEEFQVGGPITNYTTATSAEISLVLSTDLQFVDKLTRAAGPALDTEWDLYLTVFH
jgi:hypothetical protein